MNFYICDSFLNTIFIKCQTGPEEEYTFLETLDIKFVLFCFDLTISQLMRSISLLFCYKRNSFFNFIKCFYIVQTIKEFLKNDSNIKHFCFLKINKTLLKVEMFSVDNM